MSTEPGPPRRTAGRGAARPEAGFTLVETAISIAVAGIILAALTSFFITTVRVTGQQNGLQTAIEIATNTVGGARNVRGSALPALPQPTPVTVSGITYQPTRTETDCWLPASGTGCLAANSSGSAPMYRVVVTVTWPDRTCPSSICTYTTTTLIGKGTDPVFNINQ